MNDVAGTEREVESATWRSRRLVLAREGVGFSLHDTILYAGTETRMWYANHVEAVYCIEGEGELVNDENGERYQLGPGTMYLLDGHERHTVRAHTDLRTVCVFNPPCTGREVHDDDGTYPLIVDDLYPTRKTGEPALLYRQDPVVYGGPEDGPVDAATLASYEEKGFLNVEQLIEPAEVERYQAELLRLSGDPDLRKDDRTIIERGSKEVRSIFEIHRISEVFAELVSDPRVVGRARQILGSDVYVHQSRVNYKPGFKGKDFYWHSDFETWHAEDGMPRMRAVSISIALTENFVHNGGLMIMPGSHRTFVACIGDTPADHYKDSLRDQEIGTPDPESLSVLANKHGIELFTGPPGSATMFDCNCMHGSNGNITPFPRSNIFIVFNSVENACTAPFAAPKPRPSFIAARDFGPVRPQ